MCWETPGFNYQGFINSIFSQCPFAFNTTEIIKRLKENKEEELPHLLHSGVKKREQNKGQIHKVFEESFDAKDCYSEKFIFQKLDYMHHNPVSKKWDLVKDFAE